MLVAGLKLASRCFTVHRIVEHLVVCAGKLAVEAARLFLAENQTGGVRSDGSRFYLQFR